jgi:hypothetical protein
MIVTVAVYTTMWPYQLGHVISSGEMNRRQRENTHQDPGLEHLGPVARGTAVWLMLGLPILFGKTGVICA